MDVLSRQIEQNKTITSYIKPKKPKSERILDHLQNSDIQRKKKRYNETKQLQKDNHESINSIQKDIVAIEYLEHLSQTNEKLFNKLVDRKKHVSDFNKHYEGMKNRDKLAAKKLEIMRKIYKDPKECTFSPKMNKNSRRIVSRSPSLSRSIEILARPKKTFKRDYSDTRLALGKNGQQNFSFKKNVNTIYTSKEGKTKKGKQKFNAVRFNNHMQRLKEWNEKSKSKKVKRLLQGFVEKSENQVGNSQSKKFKGFGKSNKTQVDYSRMSFGGVNKSVSFRHGVDYFDKDQTFHRLPRFGSERDH